MEIYFGETLKQLRKENALTQEALANDLGVSFQTVSKWERGETYPDITMLPEIAAYFNVTTDELLGADKIQRAQKIQAYLDLYAHMPLKDVSDVLTAYEKAVTEFPHEYALLANYMELLHMEKGSVHVQDYEPLSEKLLRTYEKIQKNCTDDAVRIRAKRIMLQHLMWQYECLGWFDDKEKFDEKYREQAVKIFETLPSMSDSREYLSQYLFTEQWQETRCKTLEELTYLLQNVIVGYYYDDQYSPREKIEIIRHMNGIIQLTDTKENPTKNRIHLIYNNGHLGHLYAEIGEDETALYHLRLAAKQAIAFDKRPDVAEQTALFYEQEKRFRQMSIRKRMAELMAKQYPLSVFFREKPEFQAILTLLQEH